MNSVNERCAKKSKADYAMKHVHGHVVRCDFLRECSQYPHEFKKQIRFSDREHRACYEMPRLTVDEGEIAISLLRANLSAREAGR